MKNHDLGNFKVVFPLLKRPLMSIFESVDNILLIKIS